MHVRDIKKPHLRLLLAAAEHRGHDLLPLAKALGFALLAGLPIPTSDRLDLAGGGKMRRLRLRWFLRAVTALKSEAAPQKP